MGTLTLADFREEVRANLGNRTDLASSTTRVDRWINLAQVRVARMGLFEELEITESLLLTYTGVAATDKILAFSALTANIRAVYSVVFEDGTTSNKLRYLPIRMWDKRVPLPEDDGTAQPVFYTIYSKKFEWYRVPDKAYTARFRLIKWPTALTTSSQTSDFLEKDDAITAAATYHGFISLGNTGAAALHAAELTATMGDIIEMDGERPDYDSVPPHTGDPGHIGDYWLDPFQRSSP